MQRLINLGMAVLATIAIVACSSSTPTAETKSVANKSEANPPAAKTEPMKTAASSEDTHKHSGSEDHGHDEAIAVDGYFLKLSSRKADKVTHVDLLLQKGEPREPVMGAKVTAQMQLPDGSSTSMDLPYKASEKVYSIQATDLAPGSYKVAILSDIDGKKVNARFNLKL